MRKFFYTLSVLVCLLGVNGNVWGTYYQYAALTASVNESGAGEGTVYAALSVEDEENETWEESPNDPSSHNASSTATSPDGASKIFQFTAYATAARGSLFATWESLEGDGSPALVDGYSMTDNPIQVKVQAYTNTSATGTNTATIKATFASNPVAPWDVKFLPSTNGTYSVTGPAGYDTPITLSTETTHSTYNNDNLILSATPNSGYSLYRYYGTDSDGNTYTLGELGKGTQTVVLPEGTVSVCAEFTNQYFLAAGNTFNTLADAIQATRKNDGTYRGTILQLRDYTVPSGYYTIPAGVTLLIPVDANQASPRTSVERCNDSDGTATEKAMAAKKPTTAYRTLTLATGAHLDVFGAIEIGGRQNSYANNGLGRPCGTTYGLLEMKSGSTITLENGANLYAWGFVIGDRDAEDNYLCSIDVRRGASVHELFQIYDWEGGSETYTMEGNSKGVFIVNEYFIQNVEVATTYRPGSALYTYCGILGKPVDGIKVVGVEGDNAAMFLMDDADESEDTWVRKSYNPTTDMQVYEINNAAKLGNLEITFVYMFTIVVNSRDYVLPITHNMKIHLLTGQMDISQNTVMLPGAEIEVDKQATVTIEDGMTLYLFDYHEWDAHIHQGKYAWRAEVRPGGIAAVRDISSAEGLGNAKLNIHGTFIANGLLITTESGADIYSNDADAGTIIFNTSAPEATPEGKELYVHNYKTKDTQRYYTRPTCPALLRNTDPLYPTTSTAGTPAGRSYCYMNGKWTYMTVDAANECFVYDQYGTYYAKPGAYVPLANGKTENADHTYSDANGQGRLYILMDECQWWEVELDNNLYKGITRDANDVASPNGKYYAYNNTTHKWEEKRYTITWKDWDGTVITTYRLTYGVTPKYLSTNPTRPADVDYTYNFTGWSPAITEVTGDQIYTATYSKEQIKYTIIFKFVDSYHNGAEIDRQQLARDEMPDIPTVNRAGWYLKWTPAVAAVTGNATYEADWMEDLPDNYTVTWKNYDGSTLKTTEPTRDATAETVLAGAPTATKPSTAEYRYEFAGWQPAVAAATADASYVAQFNEIAQTYAIRFYKEDGTTQIGETQELALGADPEVPEYAKEDPEAGRTYKLKWINKTTSASVGVSVPSVSGAADYKADFDVSVNRYTVSVRIQDESGNAVSGCAATGSGTYNHGTEVTINVTPADRFLKWADNNNPDPQRTFTIESAQNLTAICKPNMDIASSAERETLTETTKVYNLVLHADVTSSSDLVGSENLDFYNGQSNHVFFDLSRGNGKVFKHHTWYAFSVPFRVKVADILFDGKKLQYATEAKKDDYDVLYYDGSVRAEQGKAESCWKYIENEQGESERILEPGILYMIANTRCDVNVIRFTKLDGADLLTTQVNVASHDAGSRTADANWNGIANPALFKAFMNGVGAAENKAWVYNPDYTDPTNAYVSVDLSSRKAILGEAFFVQTPTEKSVVVTSSDSPAAAPARRTKTTDQNDVRYQIWVAAADKEPSDDVIIRTDEEKEDTYVLGRDLVRMGMSSIRPQMWVNRYDEKLCVNVTAPINNQADYPLGIFAPEYGEYEIFITDQQDNESMLYLTYDGEAIWNLSYGGYVVNLEEGEHTHYGLRVVINSPKVNTGIEETTIQNADDVRKVLVDDVVYIVRNGKIYTITGIKIK